MTRIILSAAIVVFVSLGAAGLYLNEDAAPDCDSEPALRAVTGILRNQFHLDGLFVNNITSVHGWYFSDRRECSAEVAEIRGGVNAADMRWRLVQYRIEHGKDSEHPVVSARLEEDVPLAKPVPSFWERLLAHF
jgi:hypothetical protein